MKCKECTWFHEGYCKSPRLVPKVPKKLKEEDIQNIKCSRYNSLKNKESLKIVNKGW